MTELARTTADGRAMELLRSMKSDTYKLAYASGRNLSTYLEDEDPSDEHPNSSLDAFGRLLRAANIRIVSEPALGASAARLSELEKDDNTRALIPELIARMWREAATGRTANTRSLYTSGDAAPGTMPHPWAYDTTPRFRQVAPAIPLSELVAFNTGINSDIYKAWYLTTDAEATRMKRVAEGTSVPRAKLTGGEHSIVLHKYGRALETTYETLRHMPIDLIQFHIQRIAVQAESDKVGAVLNVMLNGDGNANTSATVYNQTVLDPGSAAGTLTLKAWLAFKQLFANPYLLTTALAQSGVTLSMQLLNTGSANIPLAFVQPLSGANFGTFRPINTQLADSVALGFTTDAPALKIVGFDSRFAVERVYEIGANIEELETWTNKQSKVLTMTETEGYDVFDQAATKVLNINA